MLMYVFATVQMNEWRKKFRKDMIDSENALNDRAVMKRP
jgi:ABC-type transport system involved in Fe-S cluster assembly fused permease/ATPase subunit